MVERIRYEIVDALGNRFGTVIKTSAHEAQQTEDWTAFPELPRDQDTVVYVAFAEGQYAKVFPTFTQAQDWCLTAGQPKDVTTAGDIVATWVQGNTEYATLDEYLAACKEAVEKISTTAQLEEQNVIDPVKIIKEVDVVSWETVDPENPAFPGEPVFKISADNFAQAYYQITETGVKYPAPTSVSGGGGIATAQVPKVEDMPIKAQLERAVHVAEQTGTVGGVDVKYIVIGAVILLLIIGIAAFRG